MARVFSPFYGAFSPLEGGSKVRLALPGNEAGGGMLESGSLLSLLGQETGRGGELGSVWLVRLIMRFWVGVVLWLCECSRFFSYRVLALSW